MAMRRATVDAAIFGRAPEEGARLMEAIALGARQGDGGVRTACEALSSAIVHRRMTGDVAGIDRIGAAAREAGLLAAEALSGDLPAQKRLDPGGRLFEIGVAEDLFFPTVPFVWTRTPEGSRAWVLSTAWLTLLRSAPVGGTARKLELLARHTSPRFIRRLLRARSIRQRDVIHIAARRPSTPELALEVALADRWFGQAAVREALALNPFTPTWLVLVLLPTLASRELHHLRDAGDAHPSAQALAGRLLERTADEETLRVNSI